MSHFESKGEARRGLAPLGAPASRDFLIAGVVGVALCGRGALFDRPAVLASYLTAYLFWLGIALGCLAILMLHHLVGGFWGFLIRRPLEAAMMTLPLMALLFLPLSRPGLDLSLGAADGGRRRARSCSTRQPYLNVGFFILRAAIYFTLWIGLALLMNAGSKRQDQTEDPAPTRLDPDGSPPAGLALYFLSMTFAAIDWGMSLEPDWYSSIYGVMLMIGRGSRRWRR